MCGLPQPRKLPLLGLPEDLLLHSQVSGETLMSTIITTFLYTDLDYFNLVIACRIPVHHLENIALDLFQVILRNRIRCANCQLINSSSLGN